VLERDAEVTDFVQGGVTIDAPVSRDLLVSIFNPSPQNPLHDGAVIIRQLRVVQARAILPLSRAGIEGRGTRHRAAVGLTEDTDAVVVVVSEERGTLCLAVGGRLSADLDVEALSRALGGALGRGAVAAGPLDVGPKGAS
jgi:diadenylate cyclase